MQAKTKDIAKVRWHCRRGMLELDIILQRFFDQQYLALNDQQQQQFKMLLECADPEIFTWLMGSERPEDQDLLSIVEKIRNDVIH